jgi:hypothetical protein
MVIITLIAFMIAAIIFMAGVLLKSERIRNFGVSELYEAIATAVIVFAFVYVCAVLFGLTPGVFVGTINPYSTAFNLISSTIKTAQSVYLTLYNLYTGWSIPNSLSVTIDGPGSGVVSRLLGSYASSIEVFPQAFSVIVTLVILNPASAIAGFLADGMFVLYAEYYLLMFFAFASIPVFLLPGVVFRALLPTRALGGVMIAMAIGFYLVAPTLFATAYYFTAPTLQQNVNIANHQLEYLGLSRNNLALTPQSPLTLSLENTQFALNGFWMLILFYPSLIIAVTYSIIEQLANLIGGSYKATGRLRSFI